MLVVIRGRYQLKEAIIPGPHYPYVYEYVRRPQSTRAIMKAPSDCPWLLAFGVSKDPSNSCRQDNGLTFQVKEDIGLVVFEHLGDKLHIHVLDVDVLYGKHSQFVSKRQ